MDKNEGKNATVTDMEGKTFMAGRMSSGVDNELRVDTGGGMINVRLSQAQSIEFGEKQLGRLNVTITLAGGKEISGTISSGTVFEFMDAGNVGQVVTVRAAELNTVSFEREKQ